MADLNLTLACGPFDRTQALRDGSVKPDGIELTYLTLEPAEIFYRMINYREFDVSEMSISNHITLVSQGDAAFVAIPAFPSRVFRHGYFFINTGSGIRAPADLKGKRGGVVEYRQTAGVYMRGLLQHEYGVKPSDVEWVQARPDRLGKTPPASVKITTAPPGTQPGDLLERGEIDFLLSASPPVAFQRGSPKIARLFPNYRELEIDYYRRTKIYPIMHLIVIRRDLYEQHPWIALSLYKAFCAAKDRALRALSHAGAPRASFAWLHSLIEEEQAVIGKDWFPYGVQNPAAIEALLQYMMEQGLIERRPTLEELFVPSTLRPLPVDEGHSP
jgi:4,5-dihydroxyphthalate decarboxylase